jgi:phage terminase large subunit
LPAAFQGLFEPHRYKAFHGGRGSAKSHSFATALVILAAQKPLRIVCAGDPE